jgi:hypothetical protein
MTHCRVEAGDGNGTPPGLRLSWPAVAVGLTVLTALATTAGFVRANDIATVQYRLAHIETETAKIEDIKVDVAAIKATLRATLNADWRETR